MTRNPAYEVPEHPVRPCVRLDTHDPHDWTAPATWWLGVQLDPDTYHCNGFVVIEGGAECVEHQRPMSECRYLHEVERRQRWSE